MNMPRTSRQVTAEYYYWNVVLDGLMNGPRTAARKLLAELVVRYILAGDLN